MPINLLTARKAPSKAIVKLTRVLKIVAFGATIVFFIGIAAMISIIVANSAQLESSKEKQERLKNSIKRLSQEEQQYILVKNRVEYLTNIDAQGNVLDEFDQFLDLIKKLPSEVEVGQTDIEKDSVSTSLAFYDSSYLVQTFATIVSEPGYSQIWLNSFGLNPESGYRASFVFEK